MTAAAAQTENAAAAAIAVIRIAAKPL